MTILKRQRELKKAEKAALKRAKRQGQQTEEGSVEPQPSAAAAELFGLKSPSSKPEKKDQD
jgi:hypothetical protein